MGGVNVYWTFGNDIKKFCLGGVNVYKTFGNDIRIFVLGIGAKG